MIPKIIHYCWFGRNPLPPLALKCIESWKRYQPDYEIKEWNENNFDVNAIPYTAEAYKAKKYAFVSDYARFWILYRYGGVYFDTDVELLKPIDSLLKVGPFMGFESDYKDINSNLTVAPGLGLSAYPGMVLYKDFLDLYSNLEFKLKDDGSNTYKTIVNYTTELLIDKGLKPVSGIQKVGEVYIYPSEYFCPINITTKRLHITKNTYTIHHYMASWSDKRIKDSIRDFIRNLIPENLLLWYSKNKK